MADNTNDKIAELEKANARLSKIAGLNDAQRAHFNKLSGSDAESWLSKSAHERDIVLADIAKADEPVYTALNGRVFRKSDSTDLVTMAKQVDELTVAKQNAEAAERAATFAKKGDEVLKNFPRGAKGELRGRLMKAVNAEFTVPAEYEEVVNALKQHDAAMQYLGKSIGGNNGAPEANSASARLQAKVSELAKSMSVPYAVALERGTASDPEIRDLYNQAANERN